MDIVVPLVVVIAIIVAIIVGSNLARRRLAAQQEAMRAYDQAGSALESWSDITRTAILSDLPKQIARTCHGHLTDISRAARQYVSRYRVLASSDAGNPSARHRTSHYRTLTDRYSAIAAGLERASDEHKQLLDQIRLDLDRMSEIRRAARLHDVKRKLAAYQVVLASCSRVFATKEYEAQLTELHAQAKAVLKTLGAVGLEDAYESHRQLTELEDAVYGLESLYGDLDVTREQLLGASRLLRHLVRSSSERVQRLGFVGTDHELDQLDAMATAIDGFISQELKPDLPHDELLRRLDRFATQVRRITSDAEDRCKACSASVTSNASIAVA